MCIEQSTLELSAEIVLRRHEKALDIQPFRVDRQRTGSQHRVPTEKKSSLAEEAVT